MRQKLMRISGVVGLIFCIFAYILRPGLLSLLDIALVAFFIFTIYGQSLEFLKRLGPFIFLLAFYDSFRGFSTIDNHVTYKFMANADKFIFGSLPTIKLQHWLWRGYVSWYDYIFTGAYMLHLVLPVVLVILVWKTRESHYIEVVSTYVLTAMINYLFFLVCPSAPPWLAAQHGVIPPITRVTFKVWNSIGLHRVVASYDSLSPTVVSAFPSMHAAFAALLLIFATKLYGKKWGLLAGLYAVLIWFGTVYMGEHYAIDEIAGALLAVICYFAVQWAIRRGIKLNNET